MWIITILDGFNQEFKLTVYTQVKKEAKRIAIETICSEFNYKASNVMIIACKWQDAIGDHKKDVTIQPTEA